MSQRASNHMAFGTFANQCNFEVSIGKIARCYLVPLRGGNRCYGDIISGSHVLTHQVDSTIGHFRPMSNEHVSTAGAF